MSETRVDRLLDGRIALRQPVAGHRAGTDALLLAAAATPESGTVVLDAGSGVGTVGLILAVRDSALTARLVEREPDLAALARGNAALNGVGGRVTVHTADLFDRDALAAHMAEAALVVSNPPFFQPGTIRASPDRLKGRAYALAGEAAPGGHGAWLRAMLALVQPHGHVVMIHRPDALPDLLVAAEGRLGALRVRPVQPRAGAAAIRILFGGVVGSRGPFEIVAPLVLHERDGAFTPLAEALSRGETLLPLFEMPIRKSRPVRPAFS